MSRYPYQPLSGNDIRLLDLLPGDKAARLECSIRHAPLAPSTSFEALSYTWGAPPETERITIDGLVIQVRPNLFSALLHLRRPDSSRTIWIDALCINQADTEERNAQVLRMRDVYSLARSVQVWLGDANDADEVALGLVREIAAVVPDAEDVLDNGTQNAFVEQWRPFFDAAAPATIKALNDVFNRPWWTRVWIVQELSLARQSEARVNVGGISLPWLSFLVVAYAVEECWVVANDCLELEYPDERLSGFLNGIRMAQCRHSNPERPRFRLLELLNQHRDCEASVAKDYVYGLLGMSGDKDALDIKPDYSEGVSVADVYFDLVVKMVHATGSLDILCACRGERKIEELPSWVPDWSTDAVVSGICLNERYCGGDDFMGSPIAHFQKHRASGSHRAHVAVMPTTLTAEGSCIGHIQYLGVLDQCMHFEDVGTYGISDGNGKSGSGSDSFDDWLNLILDCPIWSEIEKRYGGPSKVLDAFCRTIVANRNHRMMAPPGDAEALERDDESDTEGRQVVAHRTAGNLH